MGAHELPAFVLERIELMPGTLGCRQSPDGLFAEAPIVDRASLSLIGS